MSFFCFIQNNSGGSFVNDEHVGHYVIIEAADCDEANDKAETVGIYFDGCDANIDCDCCGDRWRRVSAYHGSASPRIYDDLIVEALQKRFWYSGDLVHVYYTDGRHETHRPGVAP